MKYILSILLMAASLSANAQYTTTGIIEFERKSNLHRQLESMADDQPGMASMLTSIKSRVPKFQVNYFNYYFNELHAIYKPGKETEQAMRGFGQTPATDNIVYTNFKKDSVTASKAVYESRYLIRDTIRQIQWKILEEIRTIAGFKCRKAVGKMYDSVVVVAFYTDDIMVTGGPEMFAALPGMILEIAIPRMYTTWIATKIELTQPDAAVFEVPSKGKQISQKELAQNLMKSMKDWGNAAQRSIWWTFL